MSEAWRGIAQWPSLSLGVGIRRKSSASITIGANSAGLAALTVQGKIQVSKIRHALSVTREADFAAWYQAAIAEGQMAEESGVRGCMVIKLSLIHI